MQKNTPPGKFNIDTQKAPSDLASMLSAHIRSLSQFYWSSCLGSLKKISYQFWGSKHLAPLESAALKIGNPCKFPYNYPRKCKSTKRLAGLVPRESAGNPWSMDHPSRPANVFWVDWTSWAPGNLLDTVDTCKSPTYLQTIQHIQVR